MNRPVAPGADGAPESRSTTMRVLIGAAITAYLALAAIAVMTANGLLAVLCVMILVTVVLAPRLAARRAAAWLAWIVVAGLLGVLAARGNGGLALELLPVAISLAVAWVFGRTLAAGRTPLIARVIIAIEGRERLALPRVAGYARNLTWAWTALMSGQAALLALIVAARHGIFAAPASTFANTYLFLGGWCVPALFMLAEYGFRRWYLRDLPHDSPQRFIRRLAQNWPRLLRDNVDPVDTAH